MLGGWPSSPLRTFGASWSEPNPLLMKPRQSSPGKETIVESLKELYNVHIRPWLSWDFFLYLAFGNFSRSKDCCPLLYINVVVNVVRVDGVDLIVRHVDDLCGVHFENLVLPVVLQLGLVKDKGASLEGARHGKWKLGRPLLPLGRVVCGGEARSGPHWPLLLWDGVLLVERIRRVEIVRQGFSGDEGGLGLLEIDEFARDVDGRGGDGQRQWVGGLNSQSWWWRGWGRVFPCHPGRGGGWGRSLSVCVLGGGCRHFLLPAVRVWQVVLCLVFGPQRTPGVEIQIECGYKKESWICEMGSYRLSSLYLSIRVRVSGSFTSTKGTCAQQ